MPSGVGPFVFPLRYSTGTILNYPTAKPMTVTVLLFASYADRLGTNQLSLELTSGATVSDVLGRARRRGVTCGERGDVAVRRHGPRRQRRSAGERHRVQCVPLDGGA